MADVNRGSRPLSPHLTIYKPQLHSAMSIFHRITGVGLTLGALLGVWWFMAAATSDEYFAFVDGLMTSFVGDLVMLGSLAALIYHSLNGIRHLWWDTGRGFALEQVRQSGLVVIGATAVLTLLVILIA
ncbi:MAG: succinate dehydrogenase, cytochrome b556 subunit [Pseudomonadota bacterium]